MKEKEPKAKRGRGRPRIYVMPEPIPDTPEEHRSGLHAGTASEGVGFSESRLGSQGREEVAPRVVICPLAGVAKIVYNSHSKREK